MSLCANNNYNDGAQQQHDGNADSTEHIQQKGDSVGQELEK